MSVYSWTNRDKEEKKADSTPTQLAVLMFSRRNASTLFHCCVFFGASLFFKKKTFASFFPLFYLNSETLCLEGVKIINCEFI